MLSAIRFNLDQSKILSSGNGLMSMGKAPEIAVSKVFLFSTKNSAITTGDEYYRPPPPPPFAPCPQQVLAKKLPLITDITEHQSSSKGYNLVKTQ